MNSVLCDKLKFRLNPVGVFFTDERPENAVQARPGQRVCAASMLIACAGRGVTAAFDEETYGCAGGGVGLCFGNAFEKNGHPTEALLSRGDEVLRAQGKTYTRSLGIGERFFETPELVRKWADAVPYTETEQRYVVFRPLSDIPDGQRPDLVVLFANPDQLSALVVLSGYCRGTAWNVAAPFASACQSILLAYQQIGKPEPQAVMGFFDLSQRCNIPKELLSLTVPYAMFEELEHGAKDGCLETEAWKKIAGRWEESE